MASKGVTDNQELIIQVPIPARIACRETVFKEAYTISLKWKRVLCWFILDFRAKILAGLRERLWSLLTLA